MPHAPTPLSVTPRALEVVRTALLRARHAEPCGYLLGRRRPGRPPEVLEAVVGCNEHATPHYAFCLAAAEHQAIARSARARGLAVVGTWHGHLHGPARPGWADRAALRLPGLGCMLIGARGPGTVPPVRAYVALDGGVEPLPLEARSATCLLRPSRASSGPQPCA